jgi:hypothetical protein
MVEQAVALNPNSAVAWHSLGWIALMCGEAERAIDGFDRMIRLSPLDPLRIGAWIGSSFALFCLDRFDEGCAMALKSIQFVADAHSLGAFIMNAARAERGAEARDAAARLLRLHPDFRASYSADAFPVRFAGVRERINAALRDAGLPE